MPRHLHQPNIIPLNPNREEATAELVVMTPERASDLLKNNVGNRSVSQMAVDRLARDMTAGVFRFNGDAIRVRVDGVLADGQHRLLACVQSGVSFKTMLVTGLDREDMLTLDRGRKRSIGDNLTIAYGYPSGNQLAAACRTLTVLATGTFRANVTAKEAALLLERHPGLITSNRRIRTVKPASHSGVCAIHYIGSHVSELPDRADAFAKVFRTGVPDYPGDPAHLFREQLWVDRTRRARMSPRQHLATLTYVWQRFSRYEKVDALRPWVSPTLPGWTTTELGSSIKPVEWRD